MSFSDVLNIILACLIMAIMVLALVYVYITYKNKNNDNQKKDEKNKQGEEKQKGGKTYTKIPIYDFMQFDKIEDNMIIQDNGAKYLMVVECEGINYDLMSNMEKVAVEAGFVQFLNSLRHTIQIYTQTRTINIEESISNYKQKLNEVAKSLEYKKRQQSSLIQDGIMSRKKFWRIKTWNCKATKFIWLWSRRNRRYRKNKSE